MLRVFCDNQIVCTKPAQSGGSCSDDNLTAARARFYTKGRTTMNGRTCSDEQHCSQTCTFSAPKQVVVPAHTSLADICTMISAAGIQFPAISKPIASDGTDGSHSLTLFLCSEALQVRQACIPTQLSSLLRNMDGHRPMRAVN
jgi:hypothetical protein